MMRHAARGFLGLCFAFLALVSTASAQNVATSGQIRGRVTDPSGQGVVGASVVARNTQTGLQRQALSEADGTYTIRLLPPGTYTVTAQMLGFGNRELPDVRVLLGQTA